MLLSVNNKQLEKNHLSLMKPVNRSEITVGSGNRRVETLSSNPYPPFRLRPSSQPPLALNSHRYMTLLSSCVSVRLRVTYQLGQI